MARLRTMVSGLTGLGWASPAFQAPEMGAQPAGCAPWRRKGRASTSPSSTSWRKARSILVSMLPPAIGTTTWPGSRQPRCSAISKPTVFDPSA